MPYITKDQVAEKRSLLKKALPEFNLSVRKLHSNKIEVAIMSGPFEMTKKPDGYEPVNDFYINENYREQPEIKQVLNTINTICKSDQSELVYDDDYGSVPNFYVGITIGKWDRPYKII